MNYSIEAGKTELAEEQLESAKWSDEKCSLPETSASTETLAEKADHLPREQYLPEQTLVGSEALYQVVSHQGTIYPEGGSEAWLVVFGSFCGMLSVFGLMNSIGVFQAYFSTNQLKNYSESAIGWIFSVYLFLSFFCGIQIGPIFDAKGPKLLIFIGNILLLCFIFLLGICKEYYQFMLVFGVLGGLATSLIFTPSISSIGHFFHQRRGYATGIGLTAGAIGAIVFPLMLQALFPRLGFAWATRILGFIYIILCGVSQLLIRSRLPPQHGSSVLPDFQMFKDINFTLTTIGVLFMEVGLFIPITYIPSFALTSGAIGPALCYQLPAILNTGSVLGRWFPGYFSDRIGRFNCIIVALFFCSTSTFGLWLPATCLNSAMSAAVVKGLTIAYAFFFGFASGSNISLTPVCIGQLCSTHDYGRYYSTCYTVVSFGTLVGIPIGGALLQATGGRYLGVCIFTGGCYAISLIAFIVVRVLKVGSGLKVMF